MPVLRLDHIQLAMPAGREDEARHFYGTLLGIPECDKPDLLKARGGCWFQNGTLKVHLGVDPAFVPARKAHPAFQVHDLRSLRQRSTPPGFAHPKTSRSPATTGAMSTIRSATASN